MTSSGRWMLALLLAASPALGCVVWPAGSGPGAAEMPLAEALALQARGEAVFIDLRSPAAYAAGHIPGAVSIPPEEIEKQALEIRKMGRLPIFYCG